MFFYHVTSNKRCATDKNQLKKILFLSIPRSIHFDQLRNLDTSIQRRSNADDIHNKQPTAKTEQSNDTIKFLKELKSMIISLINLLTNVLTKMPLKIIIYILQLLKHQ